MRSNGPLPTSPKLRPENEHYRLIVENPVAGAQFFHFIVEMFIKHVLGVNQDHPGIYGKTVAYYATVEQQRRLTLDLHILLWILNSLSPQEIGDRTITVDRGGYDLSAYALAILVHIYNSLINMRCLHILPHMRTSTIVLQTLDMWKDTVQF
jgi:hypothetical protein